MKDQPVKQTRLFIDYGNRETTNIDGASINVDYSEGAPCPYNQKYYTDP